MLDLIFIFSIELKSPKREGCGMSSSKAEITTTIICSILVAATAVIAAKIARTPVVVHRNIVGTQFENVSSSDYFPLTVGNYWVYRRNAHYTVVGGEVERNSSTIKHEVTEEYLYPHAEFYVITVSDTRQDSGDSNPADSVLACNSGTTHFGYLVLSNKVYIVYEDIQSVTDAVVSGHGINASLVSIPHMILEFPLFVGLRYGAVPSILANSEYAYCWNVQDCTVYHEVMDGNIIERPLYTIAFNTGPGCIMREFMPYRGITRYVYDHHGSLDHEEMELIEYSVHIDGNEPHRSGSF